VQYNKRLFYKDIVSIVFIGHLISLGLVIIFDKGQYEQERFVINSNNLQSTVVFMPLRKRVSQDPKMKKSDQADVTKKVISYEDYQHKLALEKKKTTVETKKKVENKSLIKVVKKESSAKKIVKKSPTTIAQDKPEKKVEKKPVSKVEKEKSLKKNPEKKPTILKPIKEDPLKKKKIEEIKQAVTPDIKTEKSVPTEKEIVKPVPVEKSIVDSVVEPEKTEEVEKVAEDIDLDNVSFIGRHDLDRLQIQNFISIEANKYYKPPVGISKKAVCELIVFVDSQGKPEITIKKGSGSMANDICARAALLQVVYPKEVIGKEIIVVLGQ